MEDDEQPGFVDALLEASLERYGSKEPRPGLESRLLARLRTEPLPAQRRAWVWAIGMAAAAVIVFAIVITRPSRREPVSIAPPPPVAANKTGPAPVINAQKLQKPQAPIRHAARVRARQSRPAQFPTPTPLSEQEKLLLVYVKEAPKAVLAAPVTKPIDEPLEITRLTIAPLRIKELPRRKD